eukprot:scaffold4978_cov122-Skeletonema_dohrnii-CCMP3373.AAC.4
MAALPIEQPMRSSRRLDMAGRTRKGPTNSGATKGCLLFHTFYILAAIACAGASRPHTTAFVTRRAGGQNKKLQSDNYNTVATNCYGWCQKGMTTNKSTKSMIGFGSSAAILPNPTRPNSWLLSATSADSEAVSSPVEDEDEWRTVLAAFQMYKAAYGDLKVPSRFVVPGMAPWPELAWKMKLGQRVAAIRSTGKYVQNNEGRRKILDDMGFLWRLRSPSPGKKLDGIAFEQVYDALKTYREQVQPTGPLDVPANYVVPDCEPWPDSTRGLPLGKIIPAVRTKAYYKQHPEAEAKLNSLGFQPDVTTAANDLRYKRVFDALKKYKELYGDLLVPQPFTVPDSEDWPEEVRGLRLGARVNAIRSQGTFVKSNPARRDELDELGFVWEPPTNAEGKKRGRKRKDEMEAEGDDSASGAMASLFGTAASSFDTTRDPFFTGDQSTPPQWAFEGDDDDAAFMEEEKESTKVAVPKSFNETLEEMAEVAMSVGIMERWTPQKRVVKGARPKYVPWRNDDFGADFVFEDVVEALTLYKELYENFDSIEEDEFVVPEPVEESLRLSPFELAAMNGDSPDDLDDLDAPWSEDEDDLDDKFSVVASNDWPEHLAGMKLGQIVSRIREGGLEVKHLPERKAMLDDIDFDWGDPRRFIDVPFEKVMCALFGYFMIRGDTFVRPGFVMPEERPWPTILAGFELGAAVTRLRQLQNFLETYHPVKMSLLRMVDFSFFPELAEPLDPNADEMNMEHLYVETFGHPLYHISTVPLGLPERMLADGPNGPPEKLSSWYNYEYVREFHERPGALTDVADWMRDIGFVQLAEEHEQKYGQSHYRQLFLLKEKLENGEIGQDIWDQEIERIQEEVMLEFENWSQPSEKSQIMNDGEFDYSIDEDSYYYQTLELGSAGGNSPDSPQFERRMIPNQTRDVMEEPVAEFSLNGDGDDM